MSKLSNSKLLLKKILHQHNLTLSSLHSNPTSEPHKNLCEVPPNYEVEIKRPMQDCTSYHLKVQCSQGELKLESKLNSGQLKLQSRLTHELKLQSNIHKQSRPSYCYHNPNHNPIQIDCLYIQSRIVPPHQQTIEPSINDLPLQSLQSKFLTQKLKVHSSIDGLQPSKHPSHTQSHKQQSLPLSDLIITDNKYMKRSNGLNQHDTFSLAQEEEFYTVQVYDNLKTLKRQINEQIELVQKQLEAIENDQQVQKLNQEIQKVQNSILRIKNGENPCLSSPISVNIAQLPRSRSKTPQIRQLKSAKSHQLLMKSPSQQEQLLQRKITIQKQRAKQQKQTSLHAQQKLSKVKSAYKNLQLQLNFYQNLQHQETTNIQPHIQLDHLPLSPKSPNKSNYKIKYYQFLQKQKKQYYLTLKQHVMVICRQIETMKAFSDQKCQELQQQIELMRNQIRYLDVKSVEKFFFGQPLKINSNKLSKDNKTSRQSAFKNNYSEKLVSTYSSTPLHSAIPPLSPRTPYPPSPHLYSQSPQIYSPCANIKSPRVKSRSPHIYQKSPHCSSGTLITPRAIKLKDMNKMSEKSTNYSQTKIHKSKHTEQQSSGVKISNNNKSRETRERENKQNLDPRKKVIQRSKRKDLMTQRSACLSPNVGLSPFGNNMSKNARSKSKRKGLFNIRREGQMRTQPSDEYCIKSQNELRY